MRVAVLGVGLIGGSVALAARRADGVRVLGWDRDPAVLEQALAAGAIDDVATGIPAISGFRPDVVIASVPLGALKDTIAAACAAVGHTDAIVTDVGSTKLALVRAAPGDPYIGGHPLAGAETAGVQHARADLFDGATWYLTPGPDTSGVRFERLRRFVASLGAKPVAIDADAHDRLMATVSHLPHVLANILVGQAAVALGGETLPATGPSFRDATRVAGANPALWAQIYAANAVALAGQIDATIAELQSVRQQLDDLEAWQQQAAERRRALLEVGLSGGPEQELRVAVPNRPGIVAEIALTLGHAGIDISDMSLAPSTDRRSGVVGVWVASADAERARDLITAKDLIVTHEL
jgi:prephenate dehydrogenase